MERNWRSIVKSILWRLLGVAILGIITYIYTGSLIETTLITFLHHFTFLFVFYIHERLWLRSKKPKSLKTRSVCKMLTYETLCGNIILGLISLLVTGNWTQTTLITLTYIGIKHIIYILNEFVWNKIKIGKK